MTKLDERLRLLTENELKRVRRQIEKGRGAVLCWDRERVWMVSRPTTEDAVFLAELQSRRGIGARVLTKHDLSTIHATEGT